MVARLSQPEGQRLVEILADMLHFALTWEEEHGPPSGEGLESIDKSEVPLTHERAAEEQTPNL